MFVGSAYTNCVYYFAIKKYISNVYVYSVNLCHAFAFFDNHNQLMRFYFS